MNLRPCLVLAAVGLLLSAGCSGGGLGTVPVYGTVSFAGRETPKVCRLFFQPIQSDGPARPSVAETRSDGSYEVRAFRRSDGLLPGTYRISVTYFDLKPGANPNLDESWIEHRHDAGELIVDSDSAGIERNIKVEVPRRR